MIFKKFFNKDVDLVASFSEQFNLPPRVMELILSRGINSPEAIEEFLNPKKFNNPFLLKGMKELCDRLVLAKELNDKVLIFGDYDVDGISATAIMLKCLKEFGITADYYLPNRFIDGYGLTNAVIDKIEAKFAPNLIITVDCGISCKAEVEYAKMKGIDIYVTDHHEIPDELPDTVCINAKIPNQEYPDHELCGTGVAYKVAEALLGRVKAEQFLPIAAIATIADIVPLLGENRTIVTRGLKLCEKYLPVGLKAMFKEYDIALTKPSSVDISFKISPKLNASGRMGDAGDSLKLYFETDPVRIKKCIEKIKAHNTRRQEICTKIFDSCEKALARVDMKNQRVICLASKAWDKGVLGIVCSRLVEKYHKPVFLFAQEGDELHGSGRSIDDINIHELLSSLSDILDTFGGHSMAAGLSLKRKNYEEFVGRINAFALQHVSDEVFIPIKYYDQDLTLEEITPEFLKSLCVLEPFGCANPKPRFKLTCQDVEVCPMKRFPQHATIKLGQLNLTYFNYLDNLIKIKFSRQKNFIIELDSKVLKGNVVMFDGGSFIDKDAYKKLNAIEFYQLYESGTNAARYKLYPKQELLNFVGGTTTSVFGTCFVTYNCYDYIEFAKNYNTQNIYHFGIYDNIEIGYNSLLLSPKGLEWAKNYNKIVFLSPVLDSSFIARLNEVTDAEIYIPIESEIDKRKFAALDLSRDTFGDIFKSISKAQTKTFFNLFDLYDRLEIQTSFNNFYVALLVFNQLGLITYSEGEMLTIYVNKNAKRPLTDSSLYNTLTLLKDTFRRKE